MHEDCISLFGALQCHKFPEKMTIFLRKSNHRHTRNDYHGGETTTKIDDRRKNLPHSNDEDKRFRLEFTEAFSQKEHAAE